MQMVSISHKLLTKVLTSFVILTFFIFITQLILGYFSVRHEIEQELKQMQITINSSLSQAIWELNDNQLTAIGQSLSMMPTIQAIVIHDEGGKIIFEGGSHIKQVSSEISINSLVNGEYDDSSLFGFSSKLIFRF